MNLDSLKNPFTRRISTLIKRLSAVDAPQPIESDCRPPHFVDLIELEARVLYSASPLATDLVDGPDVTAFDNPVDPLEIGDKHDDFSIPVNATTATESEEFALDPRLNESVEALSSASEIVFIDSNVANIEQIATDLHDAPNVAIVILRATEDGVSQISTALSRHQSVDSIHINSHGSAGQLQLGSTTLSNENLGDYAEQISEWSNALDKDADILFYGCNLAANAEGQDFVEEFGELTDADIAASNDITGHANFGGDWELEFVQGELSSSVFASKTLQEVWESALAAPPLDGSGALWLTTRGGANADSGPSWDEEEIIQFGGSNLELESPNTDGTFESTDFSTAEQIRGIHLVESSSITVGDTTLQRGDLLLAVGKSGSFGGVDADRHDILLFRPDSLSDYSSGTYHMFLDEAVHSGGGAKNIHGISLIESDVNVGGHTLNAGSLVVARSGSGDEDLFVVNVNTTAMGSSGISDTDPEQLLIDGSGGGSNLDFSKKIEGVEVIEKAITIGGRSLSAGTILVSFDTSSSQDVMAGSDNVNANGQDIVALDIHQTEFDGNTDATPSLFFNGSDVGLNNANERVYGISVISPALASVDHAVTVDTTHDVADGNTSSITALLADRGADEKISLREAIEAANNTTNDGINPDQIFFDIQNDDSGHVYYRDDGIANSLSTIATTTLSDSNITDFDPDYPYSSHSWFRINLDNSLSQLTITDAVSIDGYSQSGSSTNTLSIGQNATLKIELTNLTANGSGSNQDDNIGLFFDTGANDSSVHGLAINRFGSSGILVNSNVHGVSIQGNFIGTDVTGTLDRGNDQDGIQLRSNRNQVGGSGVADRNVISGNDDEGVRFNTTGTLSGNLVENNYIGVDATGLAGIANNSFGVGLFGNDGVRLIDNVISGNQSDGIRMVTGGDVENATIQGNLIGVAADGVTAIGNTGAGIRIESDRAAGNLIGGTAAGQGNVVSSNSSHGIHLIGTSVSGTEIFGNFIGTDQNGTASKGNAGHGINLALRAFDNQIGGTGSGEGNVIAFNAGNGVNLTNSGLGLDDGNTIRGNRFVNNGQLAIDIIGEGVTANDYTTPIADNDSGPNRVQNFPDLISAELVGSDLTIVGELFGRDFTNYTIDFYVTGTGDTSGHGEVDRHLGTIQRITNSAGYRSFSTVFNSASVTAGESITATATHSDGSTSEFSLNLAVTNTTNNSPTSTPQLDINVDEDSGDILLNLHDIFDDVEDTDAELIYSIENVTNASLFDITNIDGAGQLQLSLAEHQNGAARLVVRAIDTGGAFTDTVIQVNVAPVNDTPFVDTPINTHVVAEDAPQSTISLLSAFGDVEDSTLAYTVVSVSNNSLLTAEVVGSDLTLDYQLDQYGVADVVVRATDSGGEQVDHNVVVTVTPVNDAPVIADKNYILNDTGTITGNLLIDASDADGDSVLATLVTAPKHGTVVIQPNGRFVYTPDEGFVGRDTFQFIATDGSSRSTLATAEVDVISTPPPVPTTEETRSEEDENVFEDILLPNPTTADDRENDAEQSQTKVRVQEAKAFVMPEAQSYSKSVLNFERNANAGTNIIQSTALGEVAIPEIAFSVQENHIPTQLYSTLASFSDDVDAATESINSTLVNSIVSASGFSLVAATWILRSGALLASMMANLPAWRIIDPLVVLGYSSDDVGEKETLHDIIENGASQDEPPEPSPPSQQQTPQLPDSNSEIDAPTDHEQ